jgi:hypothetical protein
MVCVPKIGFCMTRTGLRIRIRNMLFFIHFIYRP